MKTGFSFWLVIIAVLLMAPDAAMTAIVVNEVMANEPSSSTSLEWIELFNNSADAVALAGLYLRVGDHCIDLPVGDTIADSGYYVVCRKLISSFDKPSFEAVWGNSSGVWGDVEIETGFPPPQEAAFVLTNSAGAVELYNAGDSLLSRLEWTESGADGVSWERLTPNVSDIVQSTDRSGGTPGFLNSVTLLNRDLTVESVSVGSSTGATDLSVTVGSLSLMPVSYASLFFLTRDSMTPDNADTVTFVALPEIPPGGAHTVAGSLALDGEYIEMSVMLSDDDRRRNNEFDFVAPGRDFPSMILYEIMINPPGGFGGQWIELFNRSTHFTDCSDWQLGDAEKVHSIVTGSLTVPPGRFLLLVEDSTAFRASHPSVSALTVQPMDWPGFGGPHDTVRLLDCFGTEADRFAYDRGLDDGYSWSRLYDDSYGGEWGRSQDVGGTPGWENEVGVMPAGDRVSVDIERTHFTPDGDGVDDELVIRVTAPPNDTYSLKVFDRQGRIVRIIFENESYVPVDVRWNGLSDAGHRLPIGLYIVYFEAAESGATKKAVVIAR